MLCLARSPAGYDAPARSDRVRIHSTSKRSQQCSLLLLSTPLEEQLSTTTTQMYKLVLAIALLSGAAAQTLETFDGSRTWSETNDPVSSGVATVRHRRASRRRRPSTGSSGERLRGRRDEDRRWLEVRDAEQRSRRQRPAADLDVVRLQVEGRRAVRRQRQRQRQR